MRYKLYYQCNSGIKSWFNSIYCNHPYKRLYEFNGEPETGFSLKIIRHCIKYCKNNPKYRQSGKIMIING